MKTKVPTTVNVSMPAPMREYIEQKVVRHTYASASEYVRELVRRDMQREALDKVEALLLDGVRSPAAPMTAKDWEELRHIARQSPERHSHAAKKPHPTPRRAARHG